MTNPTSLPEDEPRDRVRDDESRTMPATPEPPASAEAETALPWRIEPLPIPLAGNGPEPGEDDHDRSTALDEPSAVRRAIEPAELYSAVEPPRFEIYERPALPERIPNFGHLGILCLLLLFGLLCTGLITRLALAHHLFGVTTVQRAVTNIHYILGSEALLYFITFLACLLIFPLVWHKSFFAGIQWNAATALRLRWRLVSAAGICVLLALLNSVLVPGPSNAPIDKIFRAPGAAWLLFGFGVTIAPFFEEMFFRGFLLPALCTACDWFGEKTRHAPRLPLGENGHPQWTMTAMVTASIATSIPFALLHAEQTGYAIGPFLLLIGVSIVLCAIRLSTHSLAASVLVHASYNFILFSLMLIGTSGFRHLQNM